MSFRYIGSKARLAHPLGEHIGQPYGGRFIDAMCGTGAVAAVAADLGWPVHLNDTLESAVIASKGRLISNQEVQFRQLGGYCGAIDRLNSVKPVQGYFWKTYSPASFDHCGIERKYFSISNAELIDGIRMQIATWLREEKISELERDLLVADLFWAVNRIANIAGTFGCFLSKWTKQATDSLRLTARKLRSDKVDFRSSVVDVFDLQVNTGDTVYLDPPYTKRQYASYYHILETLAKGDEPTVSGVAGLRPWRNKASVFCYKSKALAALVDLIDGIACHKILLSYSSEGHVGIEELQEGLQSISEVVAHPVGDIGRYRPNKAASGKGSTVTEYLVEIRKDDFLSQGSKRMEAFS